MDFSTVKNVVWPLVWQPHKSWSEIAWATVPSLGFILTSQEASKRVFGQGGGASLSGNLFRGVLFGAWYTFGIGDLLPRTFGALALFAEASRSFSWEVKQIPKTPEAALAEGRLNTVNCNLRACRDPIERQVLNDEAVALKAEIAAYSNNVADRAIVGSVNSRSRWLVMRSIFEVSAVALSGVAIAFALSNKAWTAPEFASTFFPGVADVTQQCADATVTTGFMSYTHTVALWALTQIPRLPLMWQMSKDLVSDRKRWLNNLPFYAFTAAWYNLAPQAVSGNWLMLPLIYKVASEAFAGRMGLYEKKPNQDPHAVPVLKAMAEPETEFHGVLGMLKTLIFSHLGAQFNLGMQAARLTMGGRSAVAISQSGLACALHASLPAH